jgi:hypothetical protein
MKLEQIDCVCAEVSDTSFNEGREILAVVTFRDVRIQPSASFGGDIDVFFFVFSTQLRHELFAAAIAIDVGGIKEVDAKLNSPV